MYNVHVRPTPPLYLHFGWWDTQSSHRLDSCMLLWRVCWLEICRNSIYSTVTCIVFTIWNINRWTRTYEVANRNISQRYSVITLVKDFDCNWDFAYLHKPSSRNHHCHCLTTQEPIGIETREAVGAAVHTADPKERGHSPHRCKPTCK